MANTKISSLALLALVAILTTPVLQSCGEILKVDFKEDLDTVGFFYDHVEANEYFETLEEFLGVWDASQQNNTRRGIWVYRPHGAGGCCGGLVDLRLYAQTFWTEMDKVELEIKYFSNTNLEIGPVEGVQGHESQHEILPPSQGELLNWTVVRSTLNTTATQRVPVDIHASLGVASRYGYLILDTITFYVNEN